MHSLRNSRISYWILWMLAHLCALLKKFPNRWRDFKQTLKPPPSICLLQLSRAVNTKGPGCRCYPSFFSRSNPTKGRLCPPQYYLPPGILDFPTALSKVHKVKSWVKLCKNSIFLGEWLHLLQLSKIIYLELGMTF